MQHDPTLAELVTARPSAARVLERHGLDYCCGGGRRLRSACSDLAVDPDAVLAEIVRLPPEREPDWAAFGPVEMVDHLEATHHRYLHDELPRLDALAAKVHGVHGDRHPELAGVLATYRALRADLEPHLATEERVLFPMVRDLAAADAAPGPHRGSVGHPVRVMLAEHDRAGELLARLRALTGGYAPPADACASYTALYAGLAQLESDIHLHVHKENNVLFPAVLAIEHRSAAAG